MPWDTLSDADVLAQFTPVEQATLMQIQANEQLPAVLANVIRSTRGSVAAGGNPLGPPNTVPDQLRSDVIAIARWQWLTSFPALKSMQTEGRKAAAASAQERLDKVAAGTIKVEIPPNADATTVPTQRPSFPQRGLTAPDRNFTDTTQDG